MSFLGNNFCLELRKLRMTLTSLHEPNHKTIFHDVSISGKSLRYSEQLYLQYAQQHEAYFGAIRDFRRPLLEYVQKTRRKSADNTSYKALNDACDTVFSHLMAQAVLNDPNRPKVKRVQLAERLKTCGKYVGVKHCGKGHSQNQVNYCNEHKLCRRCSRRRANENAREVEKIIAKMMERPRSGYNLRMLTVTKKISGRGIRHDVKEVIKAFPKLWRSLWKEDKDKDKKHVDTAWRSVEVGAENGMVHIHALMWCRYKSHTEIKRKWKEITGDSDVVEIHGVGRQGNGSWRVEKPELSKACKEVCKYVTDLDKVIEKFGIEQGFKRLSKQALELSRLRLTQRYGCALPHVFESRMGFKMPKPQKKETQHQCGHCGSRWSHYTPLVEPRGSPLLRVL